MVDIHWRIFFQPFLCCMEQVSSTQPFPPSQWDGGESHKNNSGKTRGLRQRQSNVWSKNKIRNEFTTSHWQAGVQPSPGKQGFIMGLGKTNAMTLNVSFPLPSPGLCAERGTACSAASWVSCAVPSLHLVHSHWGSQGAEKAWRLWEPCSETLVCYQHHFHHKAKTCDYKKKKKLTPSQPKPAHFFHPSQGSCPASPWEAFQSFPSS